ncbi:MAG: hypothetical protein ACE5GO_00080 [Anaerolineales bacterium]
MNAKTILMGFGFLFVVGAALVGIFRNPEAEPPPQAIAAPPQNDVSLGFQAPQIDEQGAVAVEVTPLNLDAPGATLDFQVSMNTHSVDLSMNLAGLATLTTDTGMTVQAIQWDAPLGGHHVGGTLSFPAEVDGVYVMEGAASLTLTIAPKTWCTTSRCTPSTRWMARN